VPRERGGTNTGKRDRGTNVGTAGFIYYYKGLRNLWVFIVRGYGLKKRLEFGNFIVSFKT